MASSLPKPVLLPGEGDIAPSEEPATAEGPAPEVGPAPAHDHAPPEAESAVQAPAASAPGAVSSVNHYVPQVTLEGSPVSQTTDAGEHAGQASGTALVWFDKLNEKSLRNIVRHVSKYPHRMDWAASLQAEDILLLFTVGGKLSEEAKALFPQISVWSYFTQNTDGAYYPYSAEELCVNEQSKSSATVARILLEADHHPEVIVLQHLPTAPFASDIWTNLSSCLEPLRALYLLDASGAQLFDDILAAVGPRLTGLGARCDDRAFVNSIAKHCTRLKELTLYERHTNLDTIWTTIGRNLRYLKFDQDVRSYGELDAIKRYCRKIVELDVYARWEDRELNPIVTDLYASYGEQLLFANLFTMEPTDYSKVRTSCPNAECSASFMEFSEEGLLVAEGLEAVGAALTVAVISFGDKQVFMPGMADAAYMCCNLRELRMNRLDLNASSIIQAIFSYPKWKLQVLSLSGVKQDSKKCFQIIGNTTSELVKFRYCGYMTSMDTQMGISALVNGNPKLEDLELNLEGPEIEAPRDIYSSTSEEDDCSSQVTQTFTDTSPIMLNPNGSFVETSPGYSASDFLNSGREPAGGSQSRRAAEEIWRWEQQEREDANGLRQARARERQARINDRNRAYAERYGHKFYGGEEDEAYVNMGVPSEHDLAHFVSAVKRAPNLRQLIIQIPHYLIPEPPRKYENVVDACMTFWKRRVHVSIGGINYRE